MLQLNTEHLQKIGREVMGKVAKHEGGFILPLEPVVPDPFLFSHYQPAFEHVQSQAKSLDYLDRGLPVSLRESVHIFARV